MPTAVLDASPLLRWATEHGCSLPSARVAPCLSSGGWGIFNSTSTSASDDDTKRRAVFVPNSIIISIKLISDAANDSEELADVLNALPDIPTLEPILTVFLLYQVYLQRTSHGSEWSTYLEYLPRSTLLPIAWNAAELSFLSAAHTSISRAVPGKLTVLKSVHATLQQVPGWFRSVSWEDYVRAESWVSSRTIHDPATAAPILAPVIDMANHAVRRTAAWEVTARGIELRREPVDVGQDEELTISYDVDRGTGERLHRYGFIEDSTPGTRSKAVVLMAPIGPRGPGGNVFRISLAALDTRFRDFAFLTLENWLTILSTDNPGPPLLRVRAQSNGGPYRIQVAHEQNDFEVADLESLLRALTTSNIVHRARVKALDTLYTVIEHYRNRLWRPTPADTYESAIQRPDYRDMRREVWDLIRTCAQQEGALLDAAHDLIKEELDLTAAKAHEPAAR